MNHEDLKRIWIEAGMREGNPVSEKVIHIHGTTEEQVGDLQKELHDLIERTRLFIKDLEGHQEVISDLSGMVFGIYAEDVVPE